MLNVHSSACANQKHICDINPLLRPFKAVSLFCIIVSKVCDHPYIPNKRFGMLFIIFPKTVKGLLTTIFVLFHHIWNNFFLLSSFSHPSFLQIYFFFSFPICITHFSIFVYISRDIICDLDESKDFSFLPNYFLFKCLNFELLYEIVVTAIQGLIDAADEQLNKRENSEDLSKVSKCLHSLTSVRSRFKKKNHSQYISIVFSFPKQKSFEKTIFL